MADAFDPEKPTPDDLVARFVVRAALRSCCGRRDLRHVFVLVCGYPPKASAVDSVFARHGYRSVCLHPYCAGEGPDLVADLLDSKGFFPRGVIPFADCAVHLSDALNARLSVPHNDPGTSSWRRDKYLQQEVLRGAGLPAPAQTVTENVEIAKAFAASWGPVVVKPRAASGGDGVWLCDAPEDLETAFHQELGKSHQELGTNTEMVVVQALMGEEWVVNTVSRDGILKVTDAWYGPPKLLSCGPGPRHFVYNAQFLAGGDTPHAAEVIQMVADSLTALGLQNGGAHTELVWAEGRPYIYEVNARCSGGLPRVPEPPTQLDVLAMSLFDPSKFQALPDHPPSERMNRAAVVFLISPFDGWLTKEALGALGALSTFARFERGLAGTKPPFHAVQVSKTVGLFSSPGAVVLHGAPEDVLKDADMVRKVEADAYATALPPPPPPEPDLQETLSQASL